MLDIHVASGSARGVKTARPGIIASSGRDLSIGHNLYHAMHRHKRVVIVSPRTFCERASRDTSADITGSAHISSVSEGWVFCLRYNSFPVGDPLGRPKYLGGTTKLS